MSLEGAPQPLQPLPQTPLPLEHLHLYLNHGKKKVKNHKNSKSGTPSPSSKPKSELLTSNPNSDLNSDPNSDHSPTNLGTQVPLTIKQTNLDNPSQTLPCKTSQSSPLVRIAEALNDIKADNKEFKVNSAQNTETLKNHSIILTTHATNFAALFGHVFGSAAGASTRHGK